MLPLALRVNRAVREADMATLAEAFCGQRFGSKATAAGALIERVESLCAELSIPRRLTELGVTRDDLAAIVTSSRGNSMNGNPRPIADDELSGLLEEML